MQKPDCIVILTPGFPGSEAETDCLPPVQNFVRALVAERNDFEVHVVAFQYPFRSDVYKWHGAIVHALGGGNLRFPWRLRSWLGAVAVVRRLQHSHRIIALHSMWLAECTYVAAWLARFYGLQHIAVIHGQDALPSNPYLKRLPLGRMTVVSGSKPASDEFQKSTGRNVDRVIPTGIDVNATSTSVDRTIDVLGVGSLTTIKNFAAFFEIIVELSKTYHSLHCVIVGEGPERGALESYVQEHGIADIVRFAGRIGREEVLELMLKSKILLHTSRYEGQGYVLLEALACGARVVCRGVGYTEGATVCRSNAEMVDVLTQLLASPLPALQVEVMTIEETVRTYSEIYFKPRSGDTL